MRNLLIALFAIAVLAGCITLTRDYTDPETLLTESTTAKLFLRKGSVTIKDSTGNGGITAVTDQTIDAAIISAAGDAIAGKKD